MPMSSIPRICSTCSSEVEAVVVNSGVVSSAMPTVSVSRTSSKARANIQSLRLVEMEVSEQHAVVPVLSVGHAKQKLAMLIPSSPCYPSSSSLHSPSSRSYLPFYPAHWRRIQATLSNLWANTRWTEVHGREASTTTLTRQSGRNRLSGSLCQKKRRVKRIWPCIATNIGFSRPVSRMTTSIVYDTRSVRCTLVVSKVLIF